MILALIKTLKKQGIVKSQEPVGDICDLCIDIQAVAKPCNQTRNLNHGGFIKQTEGVIIKHPNRVSDARQQKED